MLRSGISRPPPAPRWLGQTAQGTLQPARRRLLRLRRAACSELRGHVHVACLGAQDFKHPGQLARTSVLFAELPNLIFVFSKQSQAAGAQTRDKQMALWPLAIAPKGLWGTQEALREVPQMSWPQRPD